jgi:hypothetical protein
MPITASTALVVPSSDRGNPGVDVTHVAPTLAQLESIRQVLSDENRTAAALHKATAPVLAAVLDAFGKDTAAAAVISKSTSKLGDYKAGRRGLAAGELIGIFLESKPAWDAFARVICAHHDEEPPQPRRRIEFTHLIELMLVLFAGNPAFLGALQQLAAERHGAEPEETLRALRERL